MSSHETEMKAEPNDGNAKVNIDLEIPTCFERCNYDRGDRFTARVTNIYDPSKFWMVTKPRELELFQKYLLREYTNHKSEYKMPKHKLTEGLYCVICVDNAFYRARIIGFPINKSNGQDMIQMFYIDYGMMSSVSLDNIYEMTIKSSDVPQFAVRAALAGICPVSKHIWTSRDAMKFYELVTNELVGVIVYANVDEQVLGVHLREENPKSILVHEMLIKQKCARCFTYNREELKVDLPYIPKSKYPYLYPTHRILETGSLPFTLDDAEFQLTKGTLKFPLTIYWKVKGCPE